MLIACGDDDDSVSDGNLDGGADAAIDAGTDSTIDAGMQGPARCGFDQTYRVDWTGSYLYSPTWITLRPPQEYTLGLELTDGGVEVRCSMTLPCGGPGVDTEDLAKRLANPELVALFDNDGGVFGTAFSPQSDDRPRIIEREDGKRIRVGSPPIMLCTGQPPECDFPPALQGLGRLFMDLTEQHGPSWTNCDGWPAR
jgi:hypothetical protein